MHQNGQFKGFAFGFKISPDGVASQLPAAIADGTDAYWVWISLDRSASGTREWLEAKAGLAPEVVKSLLALDTRPRCLASSSGALLNLRGINPDPKSQPTDLVSVRMWIEDNRIITVQHRQLASVNALRETYQRGQGPKSSAELVVALAGGMVDRIRNVVHDFEKEVDALEDESLHGELHGLRARLNAVRHGIVPLRRYFAPQHDAFVGLMNANIPWLDDWWRSHLREIADEVGRHIDALDAIRESANIVQDTLNARVGERTNEMLVLLSIGAAAFLPLNLFVGLLGTNVAGIPAAQSPYAFWVVVLILLGTLAAEYAIFRWLRLSRLI